LDNFSEIKYETVYLPSPEVVAFKKAMQDTLDEMGDYEREQAEIKALEEDIANRLARALGQAIFGGSGNNPTTGAPALGSGEEAGT
jgi:hypothetical protein